jgi:hypothetical protein
MHTFNKVFIIQILNYVHPHEHFENLSPTMEEIESSRITFIKP